MEDAGIAVTGLDELTGLAEYRNGGLFLDSGVLALREPALASGPLPVEHEAVVEFGARSPSRCSTASPRWCVGTWIAARRRCRSPVCCRAAPGGRPGAIAEQRRPGGGPPLHVISDGTVF